MIYLKVLILHSYDFKMASILDLCFGLKIERDLFSGMKIKDRRTHSCSLFWIYHFFLFMVWIIVVSFPLLARTQWIVVILPLSLGAKVPGASQSVCEISVWSIINDKVVICIVALVKIRFQQNLAALCLQTGFYLLYVFLVKFLAVLFKYFEKYFLLFQFPFFQVQHSRRRDLEMILKLIMQMGK